MIELRPTTLEGHGVRLEPLSLEHEDGLRTAATDGRLWELRYTSVPKPEQVAGYVAAALAGQQAGHMLPWSVRELGGGSIVGSTRYHDVVASIDRVGIGYTWYAKRWQRTHVNAACKLLLLRHAFETLGCRVVGLCTDVLNVASQRAIEALGAKKDGVLRHHQPRRDGTVRDTVQYSILASEWPVVRQRLEARLARLARAKDFAAPHALRGSAPAPFALPVLLRRFERPDETREFERGRFEIVRLGGLALGRATYQPGWKWSLHVGPNLGASRCTVEHVGLVLSGAATAAFDSGAITELHPGDLFHIPALPRDSWVVGSSPYGSLHFLGADHYAAPT